MFDFGGMASGFTADLLKITGAATLSGGTVTTRSLDSSASYKMVQTYTVVQAGSLTGTYAAGADDRVFVRRPGDRALAGR